MSAEQGFAEAPAEQEAGENFSGGTGGFELDENGQRVPHGMGQSKSSRRRRRKRKGKSGDEAAGSEGAAGSSQTSADGEGEAHGSDSEGAVLNTVQASTPGLAEAGTQAQPAQRRFERPNGGNQGQNAGQTSNQNGGASFGGPNAPGNTKRWKKKFRERRPGEGGGNQPGSFAQAATPQGGGYGGNGGFSNNSGGFRGPDTHQPGNNAFKRKGGGSNGGFGGGKQRNGGGGGGSRGGFVGPMDHSYRPVNGNVFDSSSTVDFSGGRGSRHTGDSQPIDYSQGRAIPIAPDAPTRIYFFIEDLFFIAKIGETARKLGVKIAFAKNEKEQIAALTAGEEEDRPGLIVFDLNNANAKPLTLIPKLKAKLKKTTSIVGFLSHLQGDLKAKAVEAGCDTVMPRAAFSQNLPNLLRRYGLEDVEENTNFNQ